MAAGTVPFLKVVKCMTAAVTHGVCELIAVSCSSILTIHIFVAQKLENHRHRRNSLNERESVAVKKDSDE
jgi:hypothetical protein